MNKKKFLISLCLIILLIFSIGLIANSFSRHGLVLGANDASVATIKGTLIWNGETTASRVATTLLNGSAVTTEANSGGYSFEGITKSDNNNPVSPQINLNGQPMYRQGISQYDELWFYAKTDTAGQAPTLTIKDCCGNNSQTVNINNYIEGGQLDTTWRLVKVPLSALKTSTYLLESIEKIVFNNVPINTLYKLYIDDIYAVDITPSEILDYQFVSDNVIKLRINERYDMAGVINAANYVLSSSADADFSVGVSPSKVGRQFFLSGFGGEMTPKDIWGSNYDPIVDFYIFLVFDKPLKNNNSYTLTVNNIKNSFGINFTSPATINFQYDSIGSNKSIAGSVKANQVGYLPVSTKIGYAGNYLGDLNELDISPTTCEVRRSSDNSLALSVAMSRRGGIDLAKEFHMFGEKVYACDFSELTTSGTYFLYVPGVGRSYNFRIADDVYNDVALKVSRSLYYRRDGIELTSQYAGAWARPAGHLNLQAVIHQSQASSSLYGGEVINSTVSMPHGWYDAGDYGKYVVPAAPVINEILNAFELFPNKFSDNSLNIPESGNGVPDILDEVKWELDWLKEMQAPDGGVYHKMVTLNYATTMPADDTYPVYLSEKTTHATAMYVAILAQAYRVLHPYFPEVGGYADNLLARAKKSWEFLRVHPETISFSSAGCNKNPSGIGGGTYAICRSDSEERAWAAAELFKTTGEKTYEDEFLTWWKVRNQPIGVSSEPALQSQTRASYAYVTTPMATDTALVAVIKNEFIRQADILVKRVGELAYDNNLYRACSWLKNEGAIDWGKFAYGSLYSWDLIKAYFLTGSSNASYLNTAKICFDSQLGSNPHYKSYITGVGWDDPQKPFDTISLSDGKVEPTPGLEVMGPVPHMPNDVPYYVAAQSPKNLYPLGNAATDPYPLLRRYYDAHLVPMMEPGMSYFSIAAFTYFSNVDAGTCSETWACGDWSVCSSGNQTRTCADTNACGTTVHKPAISKACAMACTESWTYSTWSTCVNGSQTRTATDSAHCGTTVSRLPLTQGCTVTCSPSWTCDSWSACSASKKQTRTCTDANKCGITVGKPATSQSCNIDSGKVGSALGNSTSTLISTSTLASSSASGYSGVPIISTAIKPNATDGYVAKVRDNSAVYYIMNSFRYLFINRDTYSTWSSAIGDPVNKFSTLKIISQLEFDKILFGANIPAKAGSLIKFDNSPKVYGVGSGAKLYEIADEAAQKALYGLWTPYVIQIGFRDNYFDHGNSVGTLTATSRKPE